MAEKTTSASTSKSIPQKKTTETKQSEEKPTSLPATPLGESPKKTQNLEEEFEDKGESPIVQAQGVLPEDLGFKLPALVGIQHKICQLCKKPHQNDGKTPVCLGSKEQRSQCPRKR